MLAFLRALFVALPLLTCGFLAWVATLRVAIVTRSVLNWWLFVGNVALNILWIVFLAQDNTDDFSSPEGNMGMFGMVSTGAAAIAYYLYADFKHYRVQAGAYAGYYPPPHVTPSYQPPANAGYGYGGPTRPVATPQPQPQQQPPLPQQQQQQQPQPYAQRNHTTPPPRIDQVRAELDELSDLLRRDHLDSTDSTGSTGTGDSGRDSGDGDKR